MKPEDKHFLKEGLPQLPGIEICVFWDWQETEKGVVASLM